MLVPLTSQLTEMWRICRPICNLFLSSPKWVSDYDTAPRLIITYESLLPKAAGRLHY